MTVDDLFKVFLESGERALRTLARLERWTVEAVRDLRRKIAVDRIPTATGEALENWRKLVRALTALMQSLPAATQTA